MPHGGHALGLTGIILAGLSAARRVRPCAGVRRACERAGGHR